MNEDKDLSLIDIFTSTRCECIEAFIRRRRLTFAGHLARMNNQRLPRILMLGEL